MSDNSFGTTSGPSTQGALNLVSGNTRTVDLASSSLACPPTVGAAGDVVANRRDGDAVIGDPQPVSAPATCATTHDVGAALGGTGTSGTRPWGTKADCIPHHEPFQYYRSTANPHHLPPTSDIGATDQANHQYDTSDFDRIVSDVHAGELSSSHLPAASFLKAPGCGDGHTGYSDPIDEQRFGVREMNALEQLPIWNDTAVVIAYSESGGWYDRVVDGVTDPSTGASRTTGSSRASQGCSITSPGRWTAFRLRRRATTYRWRVRARPVDRQAHALPDVQAMV